MLPSAFPRPRALRLQTRAYARRPSLHAPPHATRPASHLGLHQVLYFYNLSAAGTPLAEPLWRGILAQGAAVAAVCDVVYLTAKKK